MYDFTDERYPEFNDEQLLVLSNVCDRIIGEYNEHSWIAELLEDIYVNGMSEDVLYDEFNLWVDAYLKLYDE
jgi:hypothetical protein